MAFPHIKRDTPTGSFTKCYPCSRFILLPIFPVAHPGASQDGALFAVALGTAYPARNFEEIRLGRVPYDAELRLGSEKTKIIGLLDAYGPLPAKVEEVSVSTGDFYPYTAEIRFLQGGVVRQTVPIDFGLRRDRRLRAQVLVGIELSANATLDVSFGTTTQKPLNQIRRTMPWQELLAVKVGVLNNFYVGTGGYPKHGDFLSEGHGDSSPG